MKPIELSIIIPTFNEEVSLVTALESIARQKQIDLEIIVSDGGSTDQTRTLALHRNFPKISIICEAFGKAQQLNAGAARATGEFILFMHADCSFPDALALRKGVDTLREAGARGGRCFAGHFRLKFNRQVSIPSLGYTYLEQKAIIDRPGCVHGDQGIMLSQEMFTETGRFSISCPLLAETRFADRLRERGQLRLLPAEILTSARRFEKEGFKERQIVNAVIMALGAVGMDQIINSMPEIYMEQSQKKSLDVHTIFVFVREKIMALSRDERYNFWLLIGEYVSSNAWQVLLFLDVKRAFRKNGVTGNNSLYLLERFERFFSKLICNRQSAFCASLIIRIWFNLLLVRTEEKG